MWCFFWMWLALLIQLFFGSPPAKDFSIVDQQHYRVGESLTVASESQLNSIRLASLSFFVGPAQVQPEPTGPYNVELRIPDVESGETEFRILHQPIMAKYIPTFLLKWLGEIMQPKQVYSTKILIAGEPSAQFTVYTNPTDERLLKILTLKDEVVEWFGTRKQDGLVDRVTDVWVTNQQGTTRFKFNSEGLVSNILAINGVQFNLTWLENEVAVKVISANGEYQLDTSVPLSAIGNVSSDSQFSLADVNHQNGFVEFKHQSFFVSQDNNAGQNGMASVCANVSSCGAPVNNVFWVTFSGYDLQGNLVASGIGKPTGPGNYCANFPTALPPEPPENYLNDICVSIASSLGAVCDLTQGTHLPSLGLHICNAIAVAIDVVTIPSGEAVGFILACESAFAAAELYCETLGASPPGAPSLAELLCELALKNDGLLPPEVRIFATAILRDGSTKKAEVMAPNTGPFPIMEIEFDSDVNVEDFSINPASPAEYQGYEARIVLSCAPVGTQVVMSISGTDGYSDSRTYTVAQAGYHEYLLPVPGAEGGIMDTIVVNIDVPDGPTFPTITTNLVFGQ